MTGVRIKAKLKIARSAYKLEVKGQLRLPFELRRKGQLETQLASGEAVTLALPRGEVLRGGDLVTASDGRVIEVLATPEKLLQAEFPQPADLAAAAYRLGDRHVPAEFRSDGLRVAADAEVEKMLRKLGAKLSEVEAPFEPVVEPSHAHAHGHGEAHHEHHHGHDHHGRAHKH